MSPVCTYFDMDNARVEPTDNPFGMKMPAYVPRIKCNHVSGMYPKKCGGPGRT
ncbi:MAG TPA: hypothetical protein QKA08_01685 [Candidatus Megaira endosymbiont of Nemacystus decipiens]|nr:hypothetical protein [Candidatus Megaera endosymbiont of Nemacystus decipiens]